MGSLTVGKFVNRYQGGLSSHVGLGILLVPLTLFGGGGHSTEDIVTSSLPAILKAFYSYSPHSLTIALLSSLPSAPPH